LAQVAIWTPCVLPDGGWWYRHAVSFALKDSAMRSTMARGPRSSVANPRMQPRSRGRPGGSHYDAQLPAIAVMTRSPTIEERRQARQEALAALETLPTEPISVRVSTAVKLTGIPRSTLYELIKSGEIETVKIGRSTFIPYRCLRRLVEG
jgi:excisionase family DNA binding protein